jgi:hypothetical protein
MLSFFRTLARQSVAASLIVLLATIGFSVGTSYIGLPNPLVQPVDAAYNCLTPHMNYSIPANTNSSTITLNYSGFSCSGSSSNNFQYAFLLFSRSDSTFGNANLWSTYYNIGGTVGGGISAGSVNLDLTINGSSPLTQGSNGFYVETALCTVYSHSNFSNGVFPDNMKHLYPANVGGNGVCTLASNPGATTLFFNYDTVGPTAPIVNSPASTMYTTAASGTVTWNASDGGSSGMAGYYVNWHWATLSNGSCVGVGGDSGWYWLGNTTSWGPTWNGGTCFQFQVLAQDGAGNQTVGPWSSWIESDQTVPTFNGSLTSTCLSPGASVTLTQSGSSDPAPSSGMSGYYYYQNNWTHAVGWTTSGTYTDPVPNPGVGNTGSYQVEATAIDNTWVNYQWSGFAYSVDNTIPTPNTITPSATLTNSTSVNLSFGGTANGCSGLGNVRISNDNSTWWTANSVITSFGAWDFTGGHGYGGGNSSQGVHTIYIQWAERGTSNWSSSISTTVTYDTSPPVTPAVPSLALVSDTGTSHTDGLTSVANGLNFTGSAEAGSTINVYVDGGSTAIGSPVIATGGTYSITTTTALTTGVHTITIKATDPAGNASSASSAYTVVIHTTCPF